MEPQDADPLLNLLDSPVSTGQTRKLFLPIVLRAGRNLGIAMTKRLVSCCLATALCLCGTLSAQEFSYGTDLVTNPNGVEEFSGQKRGGFATAYMNFVIDGSTLTAVLRNTSPDAENWAGNNEIGSPAVTRFDLGVVADSGDPATITDWQLKGFDRAGNEVLLGNESGGKSNLWKVTQFEDGSIRVNSDRKQQVAVAPVYNPETLGGYAPGPHFFTEVILTATFSTAIDLSDFRSQVRFEYVGSPSSAMILAGVPVAASVAVTHAPEPGSLVVWAAGGVIALTGWRWRRRRKERCKAVVADSAVR